MNGVALLRKYTIVHWCLIHEPQLCEMLSEVGFGGECEDEWLSKNVLKQYGNFLHKVSRSEEYYKRSKASGVVEFSFDLLFYIINLLKSLFHSVRKISPLARYYNQVEHHSKHFLSDFVYVNAYHAQELYTTFKVMLGEIIRRPE